MARTDIHRPAAIIPADYDFVAFECVKVEGIGDVAFLALNRERIREHMEKTGGERSTHKHGGNCHICGSVNAVYTALFYHRPTNVYVRVGTECAEKLDYDSGAGEAFRKNVKNARDAVAGKRKAEAILTDAGLSDVWAIYAAVQKVASEPAGREETIITDIVNKLVQYGSISEAQTNFLRKLLNDINTRSERQAARAAERESAKPVPVSGDRQLVQGLVVGFRTTDWGTNMLVKHADGWVVSGSLPRSLGDVQKGAAVEFIAVLKVSRSDPKFGYYSRPTKAKVLGA